MNKIPRVYLDETAKRRGVQAFIKKRSENARKESDEYKKLAIHMEGVMPIMMEMECV